MAPATRPAGGRAARAGWRLSSLPASTWGSCRRWGPPRSPPRPPPRPPPAPRGCPASRCSASWPTWSSAGAAATWPWKVSGPRGPLPAVPPVPCSCAAVLPAPSSHPLVPSVRATRRWCSGGAAQCAQGLGRAVHVLRAAEGGLRARRHRRALSTVTAWGCMQGADAGAVHVSSGYLQCVHPLRRCVPVCTTSLQCRAGCTPAPHACSAGLRAVAPDICPAELCMFVTCVQCQAASMLVRCRCNAELCMLRHKCIAGLCTFAPRICSAGLQEGTHRVSVCLQHGAVRVRSAVPGCRALLAARGRLRGSAPALAPGRRRDSLPARLPQGIPGAPAGKALAPPQRCHGRAQGPACSLLPLAEPWRCRAGPRGPIPLGGGALLPPPQPPRMGCVTASLPAPALALRPDEFIAGRRGPAAPWGQRACHARSTLCAVPAPHGHPVRAAPSHAAPPARPR